MIVRFGCPKWDFDKIKVAGVSTLGTYFTSRTPCVYIDKSSKDPVRICEIGKLIPRNFPECFDPLEALDSINALLKRFTQTESKVSEDRFLDIYFDSLKGAVNQTLEAQENYSKRGEPIPEWHKNAE